MEIDLPVQREQILERAKSFLYANARLIDRKRYEYAFEGGSAEAVIEALRAYQNDDGGFGNALEPDIRCPESQPVPVELALSIMEEVDRFDADMLDGIITYLREITLPDGGFPFVFKSASAYLHAPWWATERDDVPSVNPTGTILALLYKQRVRTDIFGQTWFIKNVECMWRMMEHGKLDWYHTAVHWIAFLQHTPDKERARALWPVLDAWLRAPGSIERNPHAEGYVLKVLDWAPKRDDYVNKVVTDAERKAHLRALVDEQQGDGGWPINWESIGMTVEAEWRGNLTVNRLLTLRSYGVI